MKFVSSLSDELKKTFSTLLEHDDAVDSRTKTLVLKLLKLLSEFCASEAQEAENNSANSSSHHMLNFNTENVDTIGLHEEESADDQRREDGNLCPNVSCTQVAINPGIHEDSSILNSQQRFPASARCFTHIPDKCAPKDLSSEYPAVNCSHSNPTSRNNKQLFSDDDETVMQKLNKNGSALRTSHTPSNYNAPESSLPLHYLKYLKHKSKAHLLQNYETEYRSFNALDKNGCSSQQPSLERDTPILSQHRLTPSLKKTASNRVLAQPNPPKSADNYLVAHPGESLKES
ncbi:hypothetical protein ACP4OV_026392 [Aristida adscensionis]